jgi:epoxyqueuosine reductase
MTLTALALSALVKDEARAQGFDRVAIGAARPPLHGAAFQRWLDAGYAGTMEYLARTRAERLAPDRLLPGMRSVVAVALNYGHDEAHETWRPVARYARGRDYHDVMRPRLRALVEVIREAAGAGVESRTAVDTSAVLERDLAAQAGLGWIGKNTNLLIPDLGSYVFIGIVLTTAGLEPDDPLPDRCGTCEACLAACPTSAFTAPYVLDARRCIAYLTIEHRGDIDEHLRAAIGEHVFGCDVCQEVCPWNRRSPAAREPDLLPAGALGPIDTLLGLDPEGFRARFRGTAISRARRTGLLRNAALVLGNRGGGGSRAALARACDDEDAVIGRAAAWALERTATGDGGVGLVTAPLAPPGPAQQMQSR